MNDAGYEAIQIMFMSGHKNEDSIRSYSRACSTSQKKAVRCTLSSHCEGEGACGSSVPVLRT